MFRNEPFTDFSIELNRASFERALHAVHERIVGGGFSVGSVIGGKTVLQGEKYERRDPSDTQFRLGYAHFSSAAEAEDAIRRAVSAAPAWAAESPARRAEIIRRAGSIMRERRLALAALIVREAGKPWKEADADVAEAIDFCDYYAAEMLRLGAAISTSHLPGEENWYFYQPRGVAAVIAPWNFPLAIACGMAVAALVTGNTTILKPSEQTSIIAHEFAGILLEAGIPHDAFALLLGRGEVVGRALTASPHVDLICFTGSKSVGLEIIRTAARIEEGQTRIKRVIAELGGKNAIIVDEDADLDEAIKGILYSAFGFAGQKCSACSRLIAVGDSYEPLLARLTQAVQNLHVGAARESGVFFGPVIDAESQERILRTIDEAQRELTVAFRGAAPQGGYFVAPVVFRDVPVSSNIWREEIFGPVLACCKAKDFSHALALAGDSQYALTGGVYSRSPAHLERAKREFKVGNLYLNRGITGALVCRQPFGGFRMSGIGSKAGGPDYLLQFMEPRVITENTMRRGFAPSNA